MGLPPENKLMRLIASYHDIAMDRQRLEMQKDFLNADVVFTNESLLRMQIRVTLLHIQTVLRESKMIAQFEVAMEQNRDKERHQKLVEFVERIQAALELCDSGESNGTGNTNTSGTTISPKDDKQQT